MNEASENALPRLGAASLDDRRTIRDYVRGDPRSVRLIDAWIDVVLRSDFVTLQEDWDDLRQETRLRVLANLRDCRFQGNSELRTYVHRITKNTAIDHWRRISGRRAAVGSPGGGAAGSTAADGGVDGLMSRDILEKLLVGLTPDERRLLSMVHVECLSYVEVATRLGVAVGTVKARVSRCRVRLVGLRRQLLGGRAS